MRRPDILALLAILLAAGAFAHAGASAGGAHAENAHDHDHPRAPHAHDTTLPCASDAPGTHEARAFPPAEGRVPARAAAPELPVQLRSLRAVGDEGLRKLAEQGYLMGAGTLDDPFVIDGFRVRDNLEIKDTTSAIVIRNSLIEGQLKLNYNGGLVHVHHNRIHDLRVNENVKRSAPTTAGLFEHNEIAFIGQLRHFSGTFAHNTVGPRPAGVVAEFLSDAGPQRIPDGLVWNFDGYHLARVHDNVVHGRVDVKVHGHYHGSCHDAPPHNHAAVDPDADETARAHHDGVDHTDRYHTLLLRDNRIRVESGPAIRFNDRNHAGDDRTANSEPNPELELAHAHRTLLVIERNRVEGGPMTFDIVNAKDERHDGHTQEAVIHLNENVVVLPLPRGSTTQRQVPASGAYVLEHGRGVSLLADNNRFTFEDSPSTVPPAHRWVVEPAAEAAGFLFHRSEGTAHVTRTNGEGAAYGVLLAQSGGLRVHAEGNRFNAQEDVHHD